MKNFLICTTICCALIDAGRAQQNPADAPPTQADVEKYMQVMHSREMIDQMLDSMSKPMHQMVHETYVKDQDKLPADFETRINRMMDDMLRNSCALIAKTTAIRPRGGSLCQHVAAIR